MPVRFPRAICRPRPLSGAPKLAFAVVLSLAMFLTPTASGGSGAEPEASSPERWKGSISMGQMTLEWVVTFVRRDDAWTVTIDIPMQGVKDGALEEVRYTGEEIAFVFRPPGAPYEAVFTATPAGDGKKAEGIIEQAGQRLPFTMERIEAGAVVGPARPQTPKPPFPYRAEEVTYDSLADGVRLAGTITVPEGDGPHPAVLLLTGSGPQDRDETIVGHRPFWVLADHLTRHGIAVLRVDDRGVGESTGDLMASTTEDLVADARAGLAFLAKRDGIDGDRCGLLGHSEGGLVATLAAARHPEAVDFVVLLAGPGLPGSEILVGQLEAILRASGVPEPLRRKQIAAQRRLVEAIAGDAGPDELREPLRELVELQGTPAGAAEQMVEQQLEQLSSRWFRAFVRLDPRPSLAAIEQPVLALIGALDLQVFPGPNLAALRKAFQESGNEHAIVAEVEGVNHLFQTARTGLPGEYATIEETIAPVVLERVTRWIRKQTGLGE